MAGKKYDPSKAVPVDVEEANERWNEYKLADGTVLRLKLVLSEARIMPGEFAEDGEPIYIVQSQNVLTVRAPDSLKRKAQ